MDKWKDSELDKMKVGGNRKAQEFFNSQPDYKQGMSLQEKYNSRAAALYRDKVSSPYIPDLWETIRENQSAFLVWPYVRWFSKDCSLHR